MVEIDEERLLVEKLLDPQEREKARLSSLPVLPKVTEFLS
jgi:hypothetical protein